MLINLKPGEWARVTAIQGGRGVRQRLSLRGIQEGSTLKVISSAQGPVVLEVKRNIVVIGRGMAAKVIVEKLNNKEKRQGNEEKDI
ncbi:MAG: FeoA domain-containing protein [Candidatus Omnitrophica bacterium]|nr:FeoA domain-containing protein [Candidatus Omnitrophota bacterium]